MKEADDPAGNSVPPKAAGPDQSNDKLDKDMKGLVYQGEEAKPEEPKPTDLYSEEKPGMEGKGPAMSTESSTILDFTEKDNRLKAIALFAIVVIIIIAVVYLVLHTKGSTSITLKTSTTIKSNTPTTTIAPNLNKTDIVNIDTLYNYTGPSTNNDNVDCGVSKVASVDSYSSYMNASTTFYIHDDQASSACQLTITRIVATTPGFRVVSSSPSTPVTVPPNSSIYILMKIETPAFNYTGPLSLTIDEN